MSFVGGGVDSAEALRCLVEILRAHHDRLAAAEELPPLLVPVFLDERERFASVISEAFGTEGGVLVDATEWGTGVEVTMDPRTELPDLVSAVEDLLAQCNSEDPTGELQLNASAVHVAITGAVAYDAANAAQRALRELLGALFDEGLRSVALAGLVWADESVDERFATVVWDLLMKLPELLNAEPRTTLVLFAGDAALNPTLHCAGPTSLRLRVSDVGLERRQAWETSRNAVLELAPLSRDDAALIVVFLGAGASVIEGLPTGNALRDRALARQVGLARVDRHNYAVSAVGFFARLRTSDRLRPEELAAGADAFAESLTLERVLLEEQAQENQRDSTTIRAFRAEHTAIIEAIASAAASGAFTDDPLVELLALQQRLVLVTVNFDRVLETKAPGLMAAFVTEDQLRRVGAHLDNYAQNGGAVPLIKLHGDIDAAETLVANVEETAAGLSAARLIALEAVVSAVGHQPVRPWWYVGYSMRDLDLEPIWANPAFADQMAEHWVAPFIDPAVRRFLNRWRLGRWRRAGMPHTVENRAVTLVASDFFRVLHDDVAVHWGPVT